LSEGFEPQQIASPGVALKLHLTCNIIFEHSAVMMHAPHFIHGWGIVLLGLFWIAVGVVLWLLTFLWALTG